MSGSCYYITKTNLRTAALEWMQKNNLVISKDNIFFESTRQDKIKRIKELECTHFVDDLEETFEESSFPKKVKKILQGRKQIHLFEPVPYDQLVYLMNQCTLT